MSIPCITVILIQLGETLNGFFFCVLPAWKLHLIQVPPRSDNTILVYAHLQSSRRLESRW